MNEEEKSYWVALAAVDGIGIRTFERIFAVKERRSLTWDEVWQKLLRFHSVFELTEVQQSNLSQFRKKFTPVSYFSWLQEQEIGVVTSSEKEYPFLLKQIDDKPFVLFTKGQWNWGEIPVAVVGTRHATEYGQTVTEKIVTELALNGATIISGFMYGVDTIAHTQALACGAQTIGVLGYGFDYRFPRSHAPLFDEFLAQGMTFVTEFAPHVPAYKGNFPTRNRIVAGMSLATIVTEAGKKSGSLITARLAIGYDRVVGAVPGAITSPYSDGTRWLINEGAKFVASGLDVLEEIKYQLGEKKFLDIRSESIALHLTDERQRQIYDQLRSSALTPEDLGRSLQLPLSELTPILSEMELEGLILREGESWRIS